MAKALRKVSALKFDQLPIPISQVRYGPMPIVIFKRAATAVTKIKSDRIVGADDVSSESW